MLELRVALASGSSAPAVVLAVDDWAEIVAKDTDVLEGISMCLENVNYGQLTVSGSYS